MKIKLILFIGLALITSIVNAIDLNAANTNVQAFKNQIAAESQQNVQAELQKRKNETAASGKMISDAFNKEANERRKQIIEDEKQYSNTPNKYYVNGKEIFPNSEKDRWEYADKTEVKPNDFAKLVVKNGNNVINK